MAKKISRVCVLNPQGYVRYPAPLGMTDTGGQTVYILQLARALGKKGIKVDIITRQFDKQEEEEPLWENVKIVRIACGHEKFVAKEKLYELMPEFVENIMHYIERKKKRYDVIHSHYWDGGYGGVLLAKMLDIPHIHTPHSSGKLKKIEMSIEDLPVQKLKPAYRYHVRIAIEQKILDKADAVVVICETSRIQLMQYYIVDFEKLHVIYPGIDTEFFNTNRNLFDNEIAFKANSILSMARLVPAKGIDRVFDALALIRNKVDFHYYLGGNIDRKNVGGEEKETFEQIKGLMEKYRLQKNVTFLGEVHHDKQLPAYYRAADIFILPSRFEPFGLTTLEAMACGTVPLVSHVAGSREVIVDGLNGYVVDTHDRKTLAKTILNLLENPRLRKKISENAAFTMKEHYSWDKIVEKFISLYSQLVNG
jgi:mannosylfructose-phosphate synthase